jgi:hypothetical protein
MKTAPFLAFVLSLSASVAWSQTADASANTAAQVEGSVQTMSHQATVSQASNVSAELAQKIDSKNAKVGDEVVARTTSAAQLQGTKLPKGTRLMGKVTDVQAKSREQHDGQLAFAFDRAVLRDGREVPIHASLRSISAPISAAAMADSSDDFAATSAPVMANAGGSARGGGGLLGGGAAAIAQTGGLVGGATSAVASAPAHVAGAAQGTMRTSTGLVSATGASAAVVTNLPGLSAAASATNSAMLQASGKNVELSGGTQLVLDVSAK